MKCLLKNFVEAVHAARILLSKEEEDPNLIDTITDLDILPLCDDFLNRRNKYPVLLLLKEEEDPNSIH